MKNKTIQIFQEMADFTSKICQKHCGTRLGSCCSEEYCHAAISTGAKDGVTYTPVNPISPKLNPFERNSKLPLFDYEKKVCIAAPHHRILCTVHHCDVASVAFIRNEPKEVTEQYFVLYDKCNEALGDEHEF